MKMLLLWMGIFLLGTGFFLWQWQASYMEWKTNFERTSITLEAVVDGGSGKDGRITPIDSPRFEMAEQAMRWLDPRSPVISVVMGDQARAYPLTVLLRHEIVNDVFNNRPIAITFCPLCNSAIVYERQVNGMMVRFGVTGNLYHSGFLMWDDLTESWWQQFTGEAIVGDFTGERLALVDSQVVSFSAFSARFPNGEILAGDVYLPQMDYSMNPYVGYDSTISPYVGRTEYDDRLPAMTAILASVVANTPKAYTFTDLAQVHVINDTIQGVPVVAFWQAGVASALDEATVATSRDVGMSALFGRELNGQILSFVWQEEAFRDEQTGSTWNIFGEAIAGELLGQQLPRYTSFVNFWFAWSMAYPRTELYTPPTP